MSENVFDFRVEGFHILLSSLKLVLRNYKWQWCGFLVHLPDFYPILDGIPLYDDYLEEEDEELKECLWWMICLMHVMLWISEELQMSCSEKYNIDFVFLIYLM